MKYIIISLGGAGARVQLEFWDLVLQYFNIDN